MTLKSVVFPAPFGPRIARRSPGATSRSTSRTACRPPKRRPTPRKRRVGSACSTAVLLRSTTYLMTWFVITPFLTTLILPCHGSFAFLHAGWVGPAGRACSALNRPPNVWSTFGTKPTTRSDRPVRLLHDLERVLVLDRLAVGCRA